jgi:hypothetical protein
MPPPEQWHKWHEKLILLCFFLKFHPDVVVSISSLSFHRIKIFCINQSIKQLKKLEFCSAVVLPVEVVALAEFLELWEQFR